MPVAVAKSRLEDRRSTNYLTNHENDIKMNVPWKFVLFLLVLAYFSLVVFKKIQEVETKSAEQLK